MSIHTGVLGSVLMCEDARGFAKLTAANRAAQRTPVRLR
jgi:hypothetical protein